MLLFCDAPLKYYLLAQPCVLGAQPGNGRPVRRECHRRLVTLAAALLLEGVQGLRIALSGCLPAR